MRVCFSENKKYVLVISESAQEYKFLHKFPAFVRIDGYFCVPAEIAIVNNVVRRLAAVRPTVKVDKEVYDFISQDFVLKKLPSTFKYVTEPKQYQDIALRFMWTVGSGGLLLDPGMGKSKVLLDYAKLIEAKTLIVCPKALLFVWEDEIEKHRPDLGEFYTVKSTSWEEERAGIASANVVIINYNKAVSMREELSKQGFKLIHLDEALIKDPSTDRTKELTKLGHSIPYRCLGSGTLVNNSIQDVFCPTRFLEPSLVGGNVANFNERYLVKVAVTRKESDGTEVRNKRVVGSRFHDEARSILRSKCIVMTKEEWLPLPNKTFIPIQVQMSESQKSAYYDLMKNYICQIGEDFVEVDNPLVMMSKLYQISNGFCYIADNKDELTDLLGGIDKFSWEGKKDKASVSKPKATKSNRRTHFFDQQPKVEALLRLMEEGRPLKSRRFILWYNMEAELQILEKILSAREISYLVIKGRDKDIGSKVRKFNSDNSVQILICQAKSVNYGITVLGYQSNSEKLDDKDLEVIPDLDSEIYTHVFYSRNFSLEVFLQQQDRSHRIGQEHDCEYYLLMANSPVEKKLNDALENKMCIRKDILVDIAKDLLQQEGTSLV